MTAHSAPYAIDGQSDFKAWRLHYPNSAKLLEVIIYRWRGASAQIRGKSGKWAAFSAEQWCAWSKLSHDQFKRALRILEQDRLVIRERHRFGGLKVHAFLQPTTLALIHGGKDSDFSRLGKPYPPPLNQTNAPNAAPTGAPSDHTIITIDTNPPYSSEVCDPPAGITKQGSIPSNSVGGESTGKMIDKCPPQSGNTAQMPDPLKLDPDVIWHESFSKSYSDSFTALTAINRKQLNDFISKCPDGYGGNILAHSVLNWSELRLRAKLDEAAFNFPQKPTTAFLLRFITSATGLWMDNFGLCYVQGKIRPKPCAQSNLAIAANSSLIVQWQPDVKAHKPATKEEVHAILFGSDT